MPLLQGLEKNCALKENSIMTDTSFYKVPECCFTIKDRQVFFGHERKISYEQCNIMQYLFNIPRWKTICIFLSCSYSDPSFYEECKAEYLKQREEYRATGIKKKRQRFTQNVWLKLKMNFLKYAICISLDLNRQIVCTTLCGVQLKYTKWDERRIK